MRGMKSSDERNWCWDGNEESELEREMVVPYKSILFSFVCFKQWQESGERVENSFRTQNFTLPSLLVRSLEDRIETLFSGLTQSDHSPEKETRKESVLSREGRTRVEWSLREKKSSVEFLLSSQEPFNNNFSGKQRLKYTLSFCEYNNRRGEEEEKRDLITVSFANLRRKVLSARWGRNRRKNKNLSKNQLDQVVYLQIFTKTIGSKKNIENKTISREIKMFHPRKSMNGKQELLSEKNKFERRKVHDKLIILILILLLQSEIGEL